MSGLEIEINALKIQAKATFVCENIETNAERRLVCDKSL